jgi:hypothetical protein
VLTPEFLLWSLETRCPIRGLEDGTDPERTERQLRAARAVSDARREGRVCEGLAVDPPNGFRIADAMALYGGEEAARRECGGCPANVRARDEQLAGCYGLVRLPDESAKVHAAIEHGLDRAYGSVAWENLCPVTSPRWYGLWIESPLYAKHLQVRYNVLAAAAIDEPICREGIADLIVALNVAFNAGLRLHVRLYPPGRVEGTWWRLVPHCPRCKAPWTAATQRCPICNYVGHPASDKKRRARGLRPYFPLDRLLGAEQATEFLVRYQATQARRESADPPPAQPPRAPPDSPPAD